MDNLTWRAKEFEQPDRHPNWYVSLWIFAAALIVVAIILKSYLLVFFIFLSALVVNIYALKVPQVINFELGTDHIIVGDKQYDLDKFDAFWIFERQDGNLLVLNAKKGFRIDLEAPLGDANPDDVRSILSQTLPEKERDESLIDLIASWLKF